MAVSEQIADPLMTGAPGVPVTRVISAWKSVWADFPVWLFLFYACLLLNTELTNLSPARGDLAPTVVFPLSVFVGFFAVRAWKEPGLRNRLTAFLVPFSLAVLLPTANVLWHRPSPIELKLLLQIYEYSNFVWAAVLVVHAWKKHPSHVAFFFGVAFVYGAVLENGGIILGFFHELNLAETAVHPFQAPLATMIGWSVVLYMGFSVVWRLRQYLPALKRSAGLSAIAVGATATMLDFQIDPLATALGCWVWHQSLPPWFLGVPLVNFVAWMCALVPFAYVVFTLQTRLGIEDAAPWTGEQLRRALLFVPVALGLALVMFLCMTLLTEGRTGPSWDLLLAFVNQIS